MPFPWEAIMRFGLAELRLPPAQFWALSLREFSLLVPQANRGKPITRTEFDALRRTFPDEKPQ